MQKVQVIASRYGTFFILILLVMVLGVLSPQYFLTADNLTQVVLQSAITILIGCGVFSPS